MRALFDDDETFASLPAAEATLLWSMRVWVLGHLRQQDVSDRLRTALTDLGVERCLGFLEGFMWALSRGASRPLAVLCLCRREVSADERALLDAFALLQQDDADEAHTLLCGLLSEAAATVALRSAENVAQVFSQAGVLLLPWGMDVSPGSVSARPRVLH